MSQVFSTERKLLVTHESVAHVVELMLTVHRTEGQNRQFFMDLRGRRGDGMEYPLSFVHADHRSILAYVTFPGTADKLIAGLNLPGNPQPEFAKSLSLLADGLQLFIGTLMKEDRTDASPETVTGPRTVLTMDRDVSHEFDRLSGNCRLEYTLTEEEDMLCASVAAHKDGHFKRFEFVGLSPSSIVAQLSDKRLTDGIARYLGGELTMAGTMVSAILKCSFAVETAKLPA